mgnify:CR=1 FL=1
MKKISVSIISNKKKYPIWIGKNILHLLTKKINELSPGTKKIAIIIDKNIPIFYKKKINNLLKKYEIFTLEINPSEKFKNLNTVNFLLKNLILKNFNRSDLVLAVGGGITGDIAGFVSSIFKRGINYMNIPTTLLAQVDSSIGGKTGVNSSFGKNLIGSFFQPKLVLIDINFLNSLSRRQMICGYAEILKHSVINDKKFFHWLELNTKRILNKKFNELIYAIKKSCEIKSKIVNKDANEKNLRMILNFGHTFAHAIEVKANYSKRINHGEAVLLGMMLATKFSYLKGICKKNTLSSLIKIYESNKLNFNIKKIFKKFNNKKFVDLMQNDKKNNDKKINLILLKKIGTVTQPGKYKIKKEQVMKYIKHII